MEMFDKKSMDERIGKKLRKNKNLLHMAEVEAFFTAEMEQYDTEYAYDCIANELPFFKTLNYTEYAGCYMIHPMQQEMRIKQIEDAYLDDAEVKVDFVKQFRDRILAGQSNKYQNMTDLKKYKRRSNLVVLPGSNKLKERTCLNKLKWIRDQGDVYFKPHPITTHAIIGEMKDLLGEDNVLPRNGNMYELLVEADTVYTSHLSESAMYAVALGKKISPIDSYNQIIYGSFYHINKHLFTSDDPQAWVNRTLNSPKCGLIDSKSDGNWKSKVVDYLTYIHQERAKYEKFYI